MTWRRIALLAASIALTVIAAELLSRKVYPPPLRRMEAADGLRAYRTSDPTTLLIGSSHGRSFERMRDILAERTGGRERLLPFALEFGKLSSYRWIIEHKIQPIADERDASGALVRPGLARFILVTEWWDACITDGKIEDNVPARAWDVSDYAADVARHGMTPFNRNYTAWKWTSSLYGSVLVADRGTGQLVNALAMLLKGGGGRGSYDQRMAQWRQMIEAGDGCDRGPARRELDRILGFAEARGLEITIVLFPRMPSTLTPRARATTLTNFSAFMREEADQRGVRLVDFTTSAPLGDEHFMADFDHVTAEGNELFAEWALAGELSFLLNPAGTRAQREP